MEKVQKEKLTRDKIISDLLLSEVNSSSMKNKVHYVYIIPIALLAIGAAVVTGIVYIALFILIIPIYHVFLLYRFYTESKSRRMRIINADISIKTDVLERITTEQIYVSKYAFGNTRHNIKTVTYFHFSMRKWKVPDVITHYDWSENYYLSQEGLRNTSVEGNEFYLVSIRDEYEVGYAYNKKFFELDDTLI